MPYDSGGNYTKPAGSTAITGEVIQATVHNIPIDDVALALNLALLRDGRAPMTGNLRMGGNKVMGAANATLPGDLTTLGQVEDLIGAAGWTVDAPAATRTSGTWSGSLRPTVERRWVKVGKLVHVGFYIAMPSNVGTAGGFLEVPIPFASAGIFSGWGSDADFSLAGFIEEDGTTIQIAYSDGSSPIIANAELTLSTFYEAAT